MGKGTLALAAGSERGDEEGGGRWEGEEGGERGDKEIKGM
jgi:hypothetical protein